MMTERATDVVWTTVAALLSVALLVTLVVQWLRQSPRCSPRPQCDQHHLGGAQLPPDARDRRDPTPHPLDARASPTSPTPFARARRMTAHDQDAAIGALSRRHSDAKRTRAALIGELGAVQAALEDVVRSLQVVTSGGAGLTSETALACGRTTRRPRTSPGCCATCPPAATRWSTRRACSGTGGDVA